MPVKAAGKTDIGLTRKVNEDAIWMSPAGRLFLVCDGMGGHNAGEIASTTACAIITGLYNDHFDELLGDDRLKLSRILPPAADVLTKAVRVASHWVYKTALDNSSLAGMGTTIVAAALEDDLLTVLHVGDSRAYRLANNKLHPLTIDHSWAAELEQTEKMTAEEAKTMVNRNVITRALGVKPSVDIDVCTRRVSGEEIYILCSDGLCGYVSDGDIRDVAVGCREDVSKIADQLIQLANNRGGPDNVSVIAFKITGKIETSDKPEIATITVNGETEDYYPAEEEWANKVAPPEVYADTAVIKGKKRSFPVVAFAFAVIALVVVFYFILKN